MVEKISMKKQRKVGFSKRNNAYVVRRNDTSPPFALAKRENHYNGGYHVHLKEWLQGRYYATGLVFSRSGSSIYAFAHKEKRFALGLLDRLDEIVQHIKPIILPALGKFRDEDYLPVPVEAVEVFRLEY